MDDRDVLFEKVRRAATEGAGAVPAAERARIERGDGAPEKLARFAELVRRRASEITPEEIARLRGEGVSEDEIFEVTVAAALGAARERLEASKKAMS